MRFTYILYRFRYLNILLKRKTKKKKNGQNDDD